MPKLRYGPLRILHCCLASRLGNMHSDTTRIEISKEAAVKDFTYEPRQEDQLTVLVPRLRGPLNRKRLLLAGAGLAVIAAAAVFGHEYLTVGRFLESTNDAYVKADFTVVAPKVSGYIAEVFVEDNQKVV